MKRKTITHTARLLCVLALAMSLTTAAFAAVPLLPHSRHPERGRRRDQEDVRPGAVGRPRWHPPFQL